MHQQIEVAMRVTEFYSPISFLKVLLKVNRKQPFKVIQMKKENFKDYQNSSKMLQFSKIPYSKLCQLSFNSEDLHTIRFKLSHSDESFKQEYIRKRPRSNCRNIPSIKMMENTPGQREVKILISRRQKLDKSLPKAKVDDIRSMLRLMPLLDQEYYKTIGIF